MAVCERILLGDNTKHWGGHAGAYRVPLFWSLDFNWTPFYIFMKLTICVVNSHLPLTVWNVPDCISP